MQTKTLYFIPLFLALFLSHAISSSAYSFNFDYFYNGTDLMTFYGDAEYAPEPDGMSKSGGIGLSRENIPFSHGRAIFINPIPFKPSASSSYVYSFKTSFNFDIASRKKNPNPGHGLAFIVVPHNKNDTVSGLGYLSLVNRFNNGNPNNHLFAVEFDVFKDASLGDINDNHVGININSANSTVSKKAGYWIQSRTGGKNRWVFKALKLSDNGCKAWIEYENGKVTVTIGPSQEKPRRPLIEARLDLSKVFHEKMYTGFAGSMGRDAERHEISDWSFENSAKN
ncbi:PREDICTED: lectin-like protein At1g53060 isoform X2 [Camelina sativa]|uniref:Lectin-like protein At1g53060 isoform X1 n=1 Tax=Camelina sativa TaxID=90675 RepID=A0ABM1R6Q8_CAMSA|nr:PREDICTED: lectin-like protein At1g53060 isoform X1 [Camelina sativa]XP_019094696.1 PREDICTED: lectin-like protein At1g53060 isoform X2 [Camelina sativa]